MTKTRFRDWAIGLISALAMLFATTGGTAEDTALAEAATLVEAVTLAQEAAQEAADRETPPAVAVVSVGADIDEAMVAKFRRALSRADEEGIEYLLLSIHAPGGKQGDTVEIMELLDAYDGTVIAFVEGEALSAGALLAMMADDLYFAPKSIIGSAGVTWSNGDELDKAAKMTSDSVMLARMRSMAPDVPYRQQVFRAMLDEAYEFSVNGTSIKTQGELLTLTAAEAVQRYGEPPAPLLGRAVAGDVDAALADYFGEAGYEKIAPDVTADAAADLPAFEYAGPKRSVYVIPIEGAIAKPNRYILKRGLKDAIENDVDTVVLDMDTPGGRLDHTLEIMEELDNFEGETITFINPDAVSAGAFITMATDTIYFAPKGVIGAAAPVSGSGQEIDPTMLAKVMSYLKAKMRAYSGDHPYRARLVEAMADMESELVIDGKTLKKPGELLSLTAQEAAELYGDPPVPLLANGIVEDIDALLDHRYGKGNYEIKTFEVTWSEELAKYLNTIMPLVLAAAIFLIIFELKTPSFGIFGTVGLALIAVVFLSNYVAGIAGHEPIVFFFVGLVLIIIELVFFPGTFILVLPGALLMLGSLVWAMADIWPKEGGGYTFEADNVINAIAQVVYGLGLAAVGIVLVWRFLPESWLLNRIIHTGRSAAPDAVSAGGGSAWAGTRKLPDVGSKGVVTKPLHPLGEVEVAGHRYEAIVGTGAIDKGARITVTGYKQFALLVDKDEGGAA